MCLTIPSESQKTQWVILNPKNPTGKSGINKKTKKADNDNDNVNENNINI